MKWVMAALFVGLMWETWVQGRDAFEAFKDGQRSYAWSSARNSIVLFVSAMVVVAFGILEIDR